MSRRSQELGSVTVRERAKTAGRGDGENSVSAVVHFVSHNNYLLVEKKKKRKKEGKKEIKNVCEKKKMDVNIGRNETKRKRD